MIGQDAISSEAISAALEPDIPYVVDTLNITGECYVEVDTSYSVIGY